MFGFAQSWQTTTAKHVLGPHGNPNRKKEYTKRPCRGRGHGREEREREGTFLLKFSSEPFRADDRAERETIVIVSWQLSH